MSIGSVSVDRGRDADERGTFGSERGKTETERGGFKKLREVS